MNEETTKPKNKLIYIIIIVVVFLLIVTVLAVKYFQKTKPQITNQNTIQRQIKYITQEADADKDMLLDDEEQQYGTNPNKKDTDNDGLSDFDEVKLSNTDPLNPDTDQDGILDGDEFK